MVADVSVTAIVPIKALSAAKGRLSGSLEPPARRAFVAWMAARVLAACAACEGITETLVVAGDAAAAEIGAEAGVRAIVVAESGLAAALAAADAVTADREATMIVAADLPRASAEDLRAVLDAGTEPGVVIAPTSDGGTGVLLRRPPGIIATAYGPGSAAAHAGLAAAAGVAALVVHRSGLAFDVDTPEQLPTALALVAESDVGSPPRAVKQP